MEEYYTPQEIADNLKLNIHTVYEYIRNNKIKVIKIGNRYRVSKKSYEEFLNKAEEK